MLRKTNLTQIRKFSTKRLEEKSYSNKAGFIYLDYLNRMEKIGDHLFNVSEALAGRKVKSAYSRVIEERN